MYTINITKILIMLQYLCFAGFIWGAVGCSTVKKLPDELPDVKYANSTQTGVPKHLPGRGMQGKGAGGGNGKGRQGTGTGSGENDQTGNGTGKGKGVGSGESVKNDQGTGKNNGTGKNKGAGSGENAQNDQGTGKNKGDDSGINGDKGEGETAKGKVTGNGGTNKTERKAENEIADFLNLDKTTSSRSGKGVNELLALGSNNVTKIPLAEHSSPGVKKHRMPAKNVGQKLILALDKSGNKLNVNDKPQQKIMLAAPRRTATKFNAAPPVLKKVDNSFMPYKPGQVITLDTNLVPAKQDNSRIICLYSGASVYLSFKLDDVKMKGLYVQGKFKVRGIVKENFSGKYVPVAILEKF